jgi:polyphosphate kinase 2 (PPK2 family)
MYMQRYMAHFPAAGEVVIFDRSWYKRAGVEYVMGFCTKEQHARFLDLVPELEKYIVDGGIQLIKIWLESSDKEQKRRFEARMEDPLLHPVQLGAAGQSHRRSACARQTCRRRIRHGP